MHKENAKHAWFTVNQPETGLTTSLVIASQVLSFENICMVTVFGPPHRFSSDADWFGKIALNKHNLWIQEIKEEENLPCIQIGSSMMGNVHHVASFDMSAFWDKL